MRTSRKQINALFVRIASQKKKKKKKKERKTQDAQHKCSVHSHRIKKKKKTRIPFETKPSRYGG